MLRIFGFYSSHNSGKEIFSKMSDSFKAKSRFSNPFQFKQNDFYIIYEIINSDEAQNYYFIDSKNNLSCFIVGDIYSYEMGNRGILLDKNLAEAIVNLYKKERFNFIQYLRGEFNLIIIDKNELFLINDKLGLSPMYILENRQGIFFSNQVEPIVWMLKEQAVDYESISHFLIYGFVPNGKTFFSGIYNQPPATIFNFAKHMLMNKEYYHFKKINLKGLSDKQIVSLTKEVFQDSVLIKVKKGKTFQELSGGWDTRFVLANLLNLDIKPVAFTVNRKKEDYIIAKKLAKKYNLEHIIVRSSIIPPVLRGDFGFNFKLRTVDLDDVCKARNFNKNIDYLKNLGIFNSPRFTGIYGTEIFGFVPHWFLNRINVDFKEVSKQLLSEELLSISYSNELNLSEYFNTLLRSFNPPLLFLNQIGRTYLSTLYDKGWERPTKFFSYLYLLPFADSKFVTLIASLEYRKYLYYTLYRIIYEKYYNIYLKIPWTYSKYRITKPLNEDFSRNRETHSPEQKKYLALVKSNLEFKKFLKNNRLIKQATFPLSKRIKELFFIFKWFSTYKDIIKDESNLFIS